MKSVGISREKIGNSRERKALVDVPGIQGAVAGIGNSELQDVCYSRHDWTMCRERVCEAVGFKVGVCSSSIIVFKEIGV